jgi:hypothetical protein
MSTSTPTSYILGKGASLSISPTSTGTLTPIAQLKQITFAGATADYADITNLSSPGNYKEYAPTLLDSGTATVTGILDPAGDPGQTAVGAAFEAETLNYFTVQFAPAAGQTVGAKRAFAGYVSKKPGMNAQLNDAVGFDFELKISGAITDTPGSAA